MLALLLWSALARAAIVDFSPPQDVLGHWQFDLYDATGAQRGTTTNPFYIVPIMPIYSSRNLTGNATTVLKTGAGKLRGFVIGGGSTGGIITLYNGTTASGTVLTAAAAGTPSGGLLSGSGNQSASYIGPLDIPFTTGLTAVTSGSTANSFTVIFY